jgi:hypothetical protein
MAVSNSWIKPPVASHLDPRITVAGAGGTRSFRVGVTRKASDLHTSISVTIASLSPFNMKNFGG